MTAFTTSPTHPIKWSACCGATRWTTAPSSVPGIEEALGGDGGGGDNGGGGDTGGVDGVVFEVDMSQETLQGGVYVTGGSIDGWCGTCTPMSDDDGDGVYQVVLDLAPGPVEYKFVNGDWAFGEVFDPVADAACTLTTGEFTNRYFEVPSDGNASIGVVCYNSCNACEGGGGGDDPCEHDFNNNGICDEDDVLGCTYEAAVNFNPQATMDDGSCEIIPDEGCAGDLDGDGVVTVNDLLQMLAVFGDPCE